MNRKIVKMEHAGATAKICGSFDANARLIEEKFGVEIDDDDIHKFITVGDVVKYLEENAK